MMEEVLSLFLAESKGQTGLKTPCDGIHGNGVEIIMMGVLLCVFVTMRTALVTALVAGQLERLGVSTEQEELLPPMTWEPNTCTHPSMAVQDRQK